MSSSYASPILANANATNTSGVLFSGGSCVLVIMATSFGTTCQLQMQGPDGSTWINANTNSTANGIVQLYLPPGQYRMNIVGATGVYATLVNLPY